MSRSRCASRWPGRSTVVSSSPRSGTRARTGRRSSPGDGTQRTASTRSSRRAATKRCSAPPGGSPGSRERSSGSGIPISTPPEPGRTITSRHRESPQRRYLRNGTPPSMSPLEERLPSPNVATLLGANLVMPGPDGVSRIDHLECSRCGRRHSASQPAGVCDCGAPLLARYRLSPRDVPKEALRDRPWDMWRYREMMPPGDPVTLGEGGTPLLLASRLAREVGLERVWIKEEGGNPTGSFKARGLSAAVTMAKSFGTPELAIPSAGNAGSALAAYGAAAGIPVHVFLPRDTPALFFEEARAYGATVHAVKGTIRDCAVALKEQGAGKRWFDVSTLKEPYRIEGKKTMGYEIAEQMQWSLPDWILYPTGGGTGLIGMVKAFDEMEALGWIGSDRPRMVSVQAAGCAPIVRAFDRGEDAATVWESPVTRAWGLRVPGPLGDRLILSGIRGSRGTAVAVTEEEMAEGAGLLSRLEGVLACPEGGASVAALRHLLRAGVIRRTEKVILFNTGTGLKYLDNAAKVGRG